MTDRRPTRRAALTAAAALPVLAQPALAQARYPSRTIRCLIPWPPGGPLDAIHRQMFEVAGKDIG
jgi:tripartite-type tricarboxylate transporter receptor subunit TctC